MNDLGFGMLDKRSVAAILFSLGLAAALGLQIPVDTSNVGKLFVDIVLFTGFLYISRSIFRLIAVSIFFILDKNARHVADPSYNRENMPLWIRKESRKLSIFSLSWYVFESDYSSTTKNFTRFLDRVILVGVVLLACQPTIKQYLNISGIIGITVMLLIYLLRGSFTYIVRDSVDAADEDEENSANAIAGQRKFKEDKENRRRGTW